MAVLNSFQRLDRVLNGQPFGNGADGAYSSATIPTLTKDSCSGTATSTTLTTTSATFANGDILILHQTRGTGVGQWEINKVASGGGTTSLTLQVALNYTYTDSGASQAQAVKILQYTNATVQAGTWTVPSWNGNIGGICPIAIKNVLTITGGVTVAGSNGAEGLSPATTTGGGFYGGYGRGDNPPGANQGQQGEGTAGGLVATTAASANAGGGGYNSSTGWGAGGSGGHAGAGSAGAADGSGTGGSAGGAGSDSADLVLMHFGGGGGGASQNAQGTVGAGGSGAGIVLFFAKSIVISGTISANGGLGGYQGHGQKGGDGAGGSILLVCGTATLGSNLITATGGGIGRIAVHHSGAVTGTTSPSFTDVTDASLIESGGMLLMGVGS